MKNSTFAILVVMGVFMALLAGCRDKGSPGEPQVSEDVEAGAETDTGKKAPGFTLENYDGAKVSLSDYKGKIVVLEWFNYECPFSEDHYKRVHTMSDLADKYKDKGVVWLAINSTNHLDVAKNREFAAKYKVEHAILNDSPGKVGRAYGAKTTPHMFVINSKGSIVYDGAIDDSPLGKKTGNVTNYVDQALAELTAGKAVSIANTKSYGCNVKYPK